MEAGDQSRSFNHPGLLRHGNSPEASHGQLPLAISVRRKNLKIPVVLAKTRRAAEHERLANLPRQPGNRLQSSGSLLCLGQWRAQPGRIANLV